MLVEPLGVFAANLNLRADCSLDGRVQHGLRGGQSGDWHAERRTAYVVETDLVTECDRLWIAAMFTADADLEIWFHTTTPLGAEADQLAHAVAIENLKRIVFNDLAFDVIGQKAARIVAAQAERRLRQVVSAE